MGNKPKEAPRRVAFSGGLAFAVVALGISFSIFILPPLRAKCKWFSLTLPFFFRQIMVEYSCCPRTFSNSGNRGRWLRCTSLPALFARSQQVWFHITSANGLTESEELASLKEAPRRWPSPGGLLLLWLRQLPAFASLSYHPCTQNASGILSPHWIFSFPPEDFVLC